MVADRIGSVLQAPLGRAQTLDRILERGLVRTVFQPIVDLETGHLTAAEALSRGPVGTALESPLAMLAAATDRGLLDELDELFRITALNTAAAMNWHPHVSLFVNAEPRTLRGSALEALAAAQHRGIDVTVELTERDISHDVPTLLEVSHALRRHGARVALDDVGADPASLALMALVRPDVVKLDMALLREYGPGQVCEVANGVRAYAEESGAQILAEGIETESDLQTARVLGAQLGQGWYFGRPAEALPSIQTAEAGLRRVSASAQASATDTPYSIGASLRPVSVGTKELLLPMSEPSSSAAVR